MIRCRGRSEGQKARCYIRADREKLLVHCTEPIMQRRSQSRNSILVSERVSHQRAQGTQGYQNFGARVIAVLAIVIVNHVQRFPPCDILPPCYAITAIEMIV